jgi:predicted SprT family Zn-dependent metalloprotease
MNDTSVHFAALAESILDELMGRIPLSTRPVVLWKKLRVSAGIAYYRDHRIALSKSLLTDEERLRSTLVHEYAHLLAYERHGQKAANHGPYWQKAMTDLGEMPKRTHNYEVERNSTRQRVSYRCQKCGMEFIRSRRLSSRRRYYHLNCGGGLRLISVEKTTNRDSVP